MTVTHTHTHTSVHTHTHAHVNRTIPRQRTRKQILRRWPFADNCFNTWWVCVCVMDVWRDIPRVYLACVCLRVCVSVWLSVCFWVSCIAIWLWDGDLTLTQCVDHAASRAAYRVNLPHWTSCPAMRIDASWPHAAGSVWNGWGSAWLSAKV